MAGIKEREYYVEFILVLVYFHCRYFVEGVP
jgi:hypothetical protein